MLAPFVLKISFHSLTQLLDTIIKSGRYAFHLLAYYCSCWRVLEDSQIAGLGDYFFGTDLLGYPRVSKIEDSDRNRE
jgi:hypothetical protein